MTEIVQKPLPRIVIIRGKENSLRRRHPWMFSGGIMRAEGTPNAGDTVDVVSADGEWLARGAYSPRSQMRVRVWTFQQSVQIDEAFFRERLQRAWDLRTSMYPAARGNAFRLVTAESDGLPGVVIDRYGEWLVGQFLSAGAERWKKLIAETAMQITGAKGFYERSDTDSRRKEGLEPRTGVLLGAEPPEHIEITEDGVRYLVDVRNGHKTGFYLDQRENRATLRLHAEGKSVLNVFAYTGGFGLAAAAAGATSVTHIESSNDSLVLAERNAKLNGFDPDLFEYDSGDAFQALRRYREQKRTFDVIVLDPPKFAASAAQVDKAARGYKDINLTAMQILSPGGVLLTFSCSGHVTPDLFQKIVAGAALDSGREVALLQYLSQSPDHPVALNFPEGHYLKGLVCKAD